MRTFVLPVFILAIAVAMVAGGAFWGESTLYGQQAYVRRQTAVHPPQLTLASPAPAERHGFGASASAADVRPLAVRPYAYGWFGASPRRHWSRSTGYWGDRRQWSSW